MNIRARILFTLATALSGCGSSNMGGGGGGMMLNCNDSCTTKATSCGGTGDQVAQLCGSVCAMNLSQAQLQCLSNASCDVLTSGVTSACPASSGGNLDGGSGSMDSGSGSMDSGGGGQCTPPGQTCTDVNLCCPVNSGKTCAPRQKGAPYICCLWTGDPCQNDQQCCSINDTCVQVGGKQQCCTTQGHYCAHDSDCCNGTCSANACN